MVFVKILFRTDQAPPRLRVRSSTAGGGRQAFSPVTCVDMDICIISFLSSKGNVRLHSLKGLLRLEQQRESVGIGRRSNDGIAYRLRLYATMSHSE